MGCWAGVNARVRWRCPLVAGLACWWRKAGGERGAARLCVDEVVLAVLAVAAAAAAAAAVVRFDAERPVWLINGLADQKREDLVDLN